MGGLEEEGGCFMEGGGPEPGGVGPLLGVGGRGFSRLWEEDEGGVGAFWLGVGGALPRPPLEKGGGGGGAEVLCFMPPPVEEWEEPVLWGREMSGSEGR